MLKTHLTLFICLLSFGNGVGQSYHAGFKSFQLKDSTRKYQPNTVETNALHYRPVDLDIWYPSDKKQGKPLKFGSLFSLLEQRAVAYQDTEDYTGVTEELAQFFVAELGVGTDGKKLLNSETNSYTDLEPTAIRHPVIVYMAGFNGMGFENFKVLEKLAQSGFVVVAVWSVGRYPGNMTNQKEDMLEQVYDAEFAIRYLRQNSPIPADFSNTGILGCSWGGMSAAVFVDRNPATKAFVSLDGTETHYFGDEDENDQYIQSIYHSELLNPSTQTIDYLYLESGDKLDEFQPTDQYHYFSRLQSDKYYTRFTNSVHADFTCIPSLLEASDTAILVYDNIETLTVAFFNQSLKNSDTFQPAWENITTCDYTTVIPYDIEGEAEPVAELPGVVVDGDNLPLPYVNIGLMNGETGTVTDTEGRFRLGISDEFLDDTLRISSIGYKPVQLLARNFMKSDQPVRIELEERVDELEEVVITAKAYKKKTLGNKTESRFISTGFSYGQLGAEMGIRINVRKTPTFVDAFNFTISYNRLSAKSIFRVNFYSVENRKPHENILTENILVTVDPKQVGSITIDLKPYDIVLSNDVVVTLEWVANDGENNKGEAIFFSLGMFNSGTIYKKSSQAKFKKHSSLGVGFNLDVRF